MAAADHQHLRPCGAFPSKQWKLCNSRLLTGRIRSLSTSSCCLPNPTGKVYLRTAALPIHTVVLARSSEPNLLKPAFPHPVQHGQGLELPTMRTLSALTPAPRPGCMATGQDQRRVSYSDVI